MNSFYISISMVIIFLLLIGAVRSFVRDKKQAKHAQIILTVLLVVSLMLFTKNAGFLTMLGASLVSIGWSFKEVINDAGSSLLLMFFNPLDVNDIICAGDACNLRYIGLNFLRSKFLRSDGSVVLVPNRYLLSGQVTIF
jgi:small-conductance mechanosensitive channel